MSKVPNEARTSLPGRVAAAKAAALKIAQKKSMAAFTIAKSMLPTAPQTEQLKFAQSLMANSMPALKVALQQTAINAHYSRIAQKIEEVHKVDMNDLLEDPSILTKEKSAVTTELKGEAKNAGTKVADDRKDAGPLPAEYPEPKRDEPTELDGQNAAKGRPDSWTEGPGKEASKKVACAEGCKGDCDHKKEASAKKKAEADAVPAEDAGVAAAAEGAVEGAESGEGEAAPTDVPAEGDAPAEGEGDEGEGEEFDPEKQNLQEAASDIEADVDRLQDAIAEMTGEAGDMTVDGEGEGEGEGDFDLFGEGEGSEEEHGDEGQGEGGEELNLDDIFEPGAMSDKVSALNDEDSMDVVALNDGDDFFSPSDPSELESLLEQEEDLSSPADMFKLDGAEADPMARLFASAGKTAADESIIAPGDLESFFETDLHGDDRDSENDHDGTIFDEVFDRIKQPTREDHRDTEPHLKEAGKKVEKKQPQGIRKLKPGQGSGKVATTQNLASLLFTDDADYL